MPAAILRRQVGVVGLRDRAAQHVLDARILAHTGPLAELGVELVGVPTTQIVDGPDPEEQKVVGTRWTDRTEFLERAPRGAELWVLRSLGATCHARASVANPRTRAMRVR